MSKYLILIILRGEMYDEHCVTLCVLCAFCAITYLVVAQKPLRSHREPQSVSC